MVIVGGQKLVLLLIPLMVNLGIVDTPDGEWYSILFQDHGAVGRIPVLIPVHWNNEYPVFEKKAPHYISVQSTRPDYQYKPLFGDDDFRYKNTNTEVRLKDYWQWNHIPNNSLWSVTSKPGTLQITTGKIS